MSIAVNSGAIDAVLSFIDIPPRQIDLQVIVNQTTPAIPFLTIWRKLHEKFRAILYFSMREQPRMYSTPVLY